MKMGLALKSLGLLLLLVSAASSWGQTCSCLSDLNFLIEKTRANYIGYQTHQTDNKKFTSFIDSLRAQAQKVGSGNCMPLLSEFSEYFGDKHMYVDYEYPIDTLKIRSLFAETERIMLSEPELGAYLRRKGLDKIEGIWSDDENNYRIAIIRSQNKKRDFAGFILKGDSAFWMPGQVKMEIKKKGNMYSTTYYLLDHVPLSIELKVYGSKFEMSDGYGVWHKQTSSPKNNELIAVVPGNGNTEEPAFSFKLIKKDIGILTLPSFSSKYKPLIDSILSANKTTILQTANLIIDVRDNYGGTIPSYKQIRNLIYTNPIITNGASVLASDDNIHAFEEVLTWSDIDEKNRQETQKIVDKMKLNKGKVISVPGDTIKLDTIHSYPRRVALVINGNSFSATELFILEAQQSQKVKVFGQPSMGGVDYLDVYQLKFPCGKYTLNYPLFQNERVLKKPTPPSRISPDIKIPDGTKDWVNFVQNYIEQHWQ